MSIVRLNSLMSQGNKMDDLIGIFHLLMLAFYEVKFLMAAPWNISN